MRLIGIFVALCMVACAQSAPDAPPEQFYDEPNPRARFGDATLSPGGLGRIRIGESIAPVQAALSWGLEWADPVELSPGCGEAMIRLDWDEDPNQAVGILTQDLIVQKITLHGPSGIRTAEGIAVGDTAAAVLAAYPNAERVNAEYVPAPGHELFVWTDRENYVGLRFEIGEDERVTAIHAGHDLRNDEGCMTA